MSGPKQRRRRERVVAADGSGQFTDLAQVIDPYREVTRVRIRPGHYPATAEILRGRLLIEGDGPAEEIVLAGGLRIDGGVVVLRGVTLAGPVQADHASFWAEGCTFRGAPDGLHVSGSTADARLRRCQFHGCAVGVRVTDGASLRLHDCAVAGGGDGLLVGAGSWVRLQGCEVRGNGAGVRTEERTAVFLHRCVVADNAAGVVFDGGR